MKLAIPAVALFLVFGATVSTYARQDNGRSDHSQGEQQKAKPAKKQARPSHQKTSSHEARPSHQSAQHAARPPQRTASRAQHTNSSQGRHYAHGRISDTRYASSFGSGHRFRITQGDFQRRRFVHGGYTFGFVDPWPVGWSYADPVYIEYVGGGYYMYNPVHPGVRITLNIF